MAYREMASQAIQRHIVHPTCLAVHADGYTSNPRQPGKDFQVEQDALVQVQDFRSAVASPPFSAAA